VDSEPRFPIGERTIELFSQHQAALPQGISLDEEINLFLIGDCLDPMEEIFHGLYLHEAICRRGKAHLALGNALAYEAGLRIAEEFAVYITQLVRAEKERIVSKTRVETPQERRDREFWNDLGARITSAMLLGKPYMIALHDEDMVEDAQDLTENLAAQISADATLIRFGVVPEEDRGFIDVGTFLPDD
jgi:hypothetical protein